MEFNWGLATIGKFYSHILFKPFYKVSSIDCRSEEIWIFGFSLIDIDIKIVPNNDDELQEAGEDLSEQLGRVLEAKIIVNNIKERLEG